MIEEMTIPTRTEKLRREIELLQNNERVYRRQMHRSRSDKVERQMREFRLIAIREELKALREKGRQHQAFRSSLVRGRRVHNLL